MLAVITFISLLSCQARNQTSGLNAERMVVVSIDDLPPIDALDLEDKKRITADLLANITHYDKPAIGFVNEGIPGEPKCLISLWNHRGNLDISDLVERLGINHIWSHDDNYTGQAWEDTHMYKLLYETGVEQVMAKIERAAWGWDHEMSIRHARWVAIMSKLHPGITGMYLNDFYDEVEDGYRTEEEWHEIIEAAKSINPDLKLWVPHYPHRDQGRHDFDFNIDALILNLWGNDPELIANGPAHLAAGLEHHPNRPVMAGLYLRAGPGGGRWLTEGEFRTLLGHYVDMLNQGKIAGLRMFAAYQFKERPEYIDWAEEILEGVTCRQGILN
jgi:hypothetical protein